jgi:hypothetical protein
MTRGTGAPEPRPDEHAAVIPDWTCGSCGDDWPCDAKRTRLLAEYQADRAALSVYLGSCLAAASNDLRHTPNTSLQVRFIGWVPRSPRSE